MQVRHPLALSWSIVSGVYLLILLTPFAIIGETWAVSWMALALPISAIAERWIGIGSDSHLVIVCVSILQAALVGACLVLPIGALVHELRRNRNG